MSRRDLWWTILSVAARNLRRQWRRTLITTSAIALGLAMFLFFMALDAGQFATTIDMTVGGLIGDAQIHHASYGAERNPALVLPEPGRILAQARRTPGVVAATPRLYATALASMGDRSSGMQVMGVDLLAERQVTTFHKRLREGSWPSTDREVLIGHTLARQLELGLGDKLVLTAADVRTGELRSAPARVSGILASGNLTLDQGTVVGSIELGRALSGLPAGVHEIALDVALPADDLGGIQRTLAGLQAPGLRVSPWQEISRSLWAAYRFNARLFLVVGLVDFLIVSFSIVNTLTMSFYQRSREFAVLRACGTTPAQLAGLMLSEAAILGLAGAVLGTLLGILICWPFEVFGFPIKGVEVHGVRIDERIFLHLQRAHVLTLAPTVAVLTALTGLGAARRASRVKPARALQQI
jgi:putative ABC transport system permease protein